MQGAYALVRGGSSTSNHIITEIAMFVEFCHMSSGWVDCTEPSLSTSLQGKQGVQGAYAVRDGSTIPNLLCLHRYRGNKECRCLCTCSGWFKHIEPRRTFPNHIITEIAKCVEFCHMS